MLPNIIKIWDVLFKKYNCTLYFCIHTSNCFSDHLIWIKIRTKDKTLTSNRPEISRKAEDSPQVNHVVRYRYLSGTSVRKTIVDNCRTRMVSFRQSVRGVTSVQVSHKDTIRAARPRGYPLAMRSKDSAVSRIYAGRIIVRDELYF